MLGFAVTNTTLKLQLQMDLRPKPIQNVKTADLLLWCHKDNISYDLTVLKGSLS